MINVYPTYLEATDEDGNVLFNLNMEDAHCCTMTIRKPLLLSNGNLEETFDAIRRGVKMLGLED